MIVSTLLWNVLSGFALGAVVIALVLIAVIVVRLVREARATGTLRRKMPTHILLVGTGSAIWGVGQLDTVYDHLGDKMAPEWSAAPTALLGALVLLAGLWKMVEVQRIRYRTLGGQSAPEDVAGEFSERAAPLPARNEERIKRLFVEMRVLFGLTLVGLIFGFANTATVTHTNCVNNNEQDEILRDVVLARLAPNPSAFSDDPVAARRVKDAFEEALRLLESPEDCPAKGL